MTTRWQQHTLRLQWCAQLRCLSVGLQVISNAGLLNTYKHLLPPEVLFSTPAMQHQLQQAAAAGNSLGIAVLYLGLNEPLVPEFKDLGTLRLYASADHDRDLTSFLADPEGPLPFAEVVCFDAREKVMPDNPAGKAVILNAAAAPNSDSSNAVSTLEVTTFVNHEWFREWERTKEFVGHQRGEGYEAFKVYLKEKLMRKLGEPAHTPMLCLLPKGASACTVCSCSVVAVM